MNNGKSEDLRRRSQGSGIVDLSQFASVGEGVVLEPGVLVFHPETIDLGSFVYVGHNAILKGHPAGRMKIGDGTWIGQQCFLHSAGNLTIGRNVGIGPGVKIITSAHVEQGLQTPILHSRVGFSPVQVENDADLGVGAIILPGVSVGRGAQVGAGSVVTHDIPAYAVAVGAPARVVRQRNGACDERDAS
jgi:acetyltransferase-like isoleucine patch superfamily enzyme